MVYLSAVGFGNREIGQRLGYTKEHVSNVLNLEQADVFREQLLTRMREKALMDIPMTLGKIAEKTVARLHELVHDDERFMRNPFAVIDRGLEIVKGVGHLKHGNAHDGGGIVVHGNAMIGMPIEIMEKLASGLATANEAKRLNEAASAASE